MQSGDIFSGLDVAETRFLEAVIAGPDAIERFLTSWADITQKLQIALQSNSLTRITAMKYYSVAHNINEMATSFAAVEKKTEETRAEILRDANRILDEAGYSSKSASKHPKPSKKPTKKKTDAPHQDSFKFRPCRDYFLEHLSAPYPTFEEKSAMAAKAQTTVNSIGLWFTNIRRRSTWMTICKEHADNDRHKMKQLVENTFSPSPLCSPVPQIVRDKLIGMRKFVDEQARIVVSEAFREVEKMEPMTDAELAAWKEQKKAERKARMQAKRPAKKQVVDKVEQDKADRRARKLARRALRAQVEGSSDATPGSAKRKRGASDLEEGRPSKKRTTSATAPGSSRPLREKPMYRTVVDENGVRKVLRRKIRPPTSPAAFVAPTPTPIAPAPTPAPTPVTPLVVSKSKSKRKADDDLASSPEARYPTTHKRRRPNVVIPTSVPKPDARSSSAPTVLQPSNTPPTYSNVDASFDPRRVASLDQAQAESQVQDWPLTWQDIPLDLSWAMQSHDGESLDLTNIDWAQLSTAPNSGADTPYTDDMNTQPLNFEGVDLTAFFQPTEGRLPLPQHQPWTPRPEGYASPLPFSAPSPPQQMTASQTASQTPVDAREATHIRQQIELHRRALAEWEARAAGVPI